MIKIKEVIVVEGRDDEINLKSYFECEVIKTNGFGISKKTLEKIKFAHQRKGIIVLTDPDYAGKMIRKKVSEIIPDCKHAYITQEEATKNDNIGVENATKEALERALTGVKKVQESQSNEFDENDLIEHRLIRAHHSKERRKQLGNKLKIGYCNGKQLLKKLNNYGITREEFNKKIEEINKDAR